MISELEKATSIIELIDIIKNKFSEYNDSLYLPAIIKEGNFIYNRFDNKDKIPNSDFYSKLIIRPRKMEITQSWLIQNLAYNFYNGNQYLESKEVNPLDFVYNIIVNKNLYGNSVYTLNPILYNDTSSIIEEDYKSNEIANLYYCDTFHSENKIPVIKKEDDNIFILKDVLKEYVPCQNNTLYGNEDYVLSVEFEYRNTNNHISDKEDYKDSTCFIDNVNKDMKDFVWLIGTFDIPLIIKEVIPQNIIVNTLDGKKRKINEHNYNDDTDAGLIVFSEDCFDFLSKRYIILGLTMFDTYNERKSYIIDNLENVFVFWEGEFNKLPREIKLELEKFNEKEKSKGIISPAMFEWQLNAKWDWKSKAYPFQYLGDYLIENYLELVREYKCNIVLPKNKEIFKEEIRNILKILQLQIEDLNRDEKPYKMLLKIMNGEDVEIGEEKLKSLFEYFCIIILEKVDKNYVKTIYSQK